MDRIKERASLCDWKDGDVINWTGEQGRKENKFVRRQRG